MRKRFLLLSAIIASSTMLALSASACDFAKVDEDTPAFAVKIHYEHLNAGRYDEAYTMLSSRYMDEYYPTVDDFIADIEDEEYPIFFEVAVTKTDYEGEAQADVSWRGKQTVSGKEFLIAGDTQVVREGDSWMLDAVFATAAP